ncbi:MULTISPECIES: endoribonuclease MazF [Leptospira]|uniref:endoribonuclease MazF n=1 Tax=Leptospira TaxID=171 RepID=UPI000288C04A|nr:MULTISPECIES: endoribonuclease MazF [Leptospira]KON77626.1 PpGpp-regulated growth inhibitor ChpA/MazF [Leptospira kirschneri serovar Mozdok]KPZ77804.1 mRNA-degrading endonuclease [Leptospira kirschneri serovar Mozdok]KXZ28274.1 mRNA-degrading endonuclease [Leptospira kirschneri]KXZ33820.1 mRNA-degrading endonuclease [Leptospira sp. ZV016]NDK07258.1 PpGpp-regulated growth inhibitor ChpA/MazF [Leptospira kirschneri serovar Mozdok]
MVKSRKYTPGKGDIVWLNFTPQAGHEQKGRRPALVLSPKVYNSKTGLAIFCPITSKVKGYPFEVFFKSKKINGVILSDQVKSLDWTIREAEFIESISKVSLKEVLDNIKLLVF